MTKYNNNLSFLTQSDGSIVHTIHSGTGKSERHIFDVFPGVRLIYNSIHTGCCPLDAFDSDGLIVIHHCREGRLEQQTEDGFFIFSKYLSHFRLLDCLIYKETKEAIL
ncbi:MAG: hypothetical protein IJM96_09850 [Clostridia bacterium]|nr:hypothetical protein [Clostridia bacterium]